MNSKAEDAAMSFFIKYPLKNRNIKRGWNSYQTPIQKFTTNKSLIIHFHLSITSNIVYLLLVLSTFHNKYKYGY